MSIKRGTPSSLISNGLVFVQDYGDHLSYISGSSTVFNVLNSTHTGSINGTARPTSSYSLYFTGSSRILMQSSSVTENLTEATVGVWFQLNLLPPTLALGAFYEVSRVGLGFGAFDQSANAISLGFYKNSTLGVINLAGQIYDWNSGFVTETSDSASIHLNKWVYMTGVMILGEFTSMNVYINGVLMNGTEDPSQLIRLIRGTYSFGGDVDYTDQRVSIGHIHVYNRVLLDYEILHNYNVHKDRFKNI